MATNNHLTPFMAMTPGSILQEKLEARGISTSDFATAMGMTLDELQHLLHGNRCITHHIAQQLEQQLHIPAKHWIRLQQAYEADCQQISTVDPSSHSLPLLHQQATHYALPHSWNNVTGQNIAFS